MMCDLDRQVATTPFVILVEILLPVYGRKEEKDWNHLAFCYTTHWETYVMIRPIALSEGSCVLSLARSYRTNLIGDTTSIIGKHT